MMPCKVAEAFPSVRHRCTCARHHHQGNTSGARAVQNRWVGASLSKGLSFPQPLKVRQSWPNGNRYLSQTTEL